MSKKNQNKIVCVTGANSEIAQYIINLFDKSGYATRGLYSGKSLKSDSSMFFGSIDNCNIMKSFITGCNHLIHCSGESLNEKNMYYKNVEATKLLMKYSHNENIQTLTFISSLSVYGPSKNLLIDESSPCNPVNFYGKTKLHAEKLISSENKKIKCINILRVGNVVSNKNPNILSYIKKNSLFNNVYLFLKGNENTHIIHPYDIALAVKHLIDTRQNGVNIYNITNDDIDNRLIMLTDKKSIFRIINPLPAIVPYFLRKIIRGTSIDGRTKYSNNKLLTSGFHRVMGIDATINNINKKF